MSDAVWRRDEPESPCVQICAIHPETRRCVGCHRTMEEIAGWARMTPEMRRAIMDELPTRAAEAPKRRGGRQARRPKG